MKMEVERRWWTEQWSEGIPGGGRETAARREKQLCLFNENEDAEFEFGREILTE